MKPTSLEGLTLRGNGVSMVRESSLEEMISSLSLKKGVGIGLIKGEGDSSDRIHVPRRRGEERKNDDLSETLPK